MCQLRFSRLHRRWHLPHFNSQSYQQMRTQRSLFPYRQSFIKLHSESHACTASILPWLDLEIRWNSEQAQTKRDLTRQSVYLVFIISAPSILSWPKWSRVNGWSWASLWKGKDLQVWFLDQLNDLPQYCTRKLLLQTLEWNCLEDYSNLAAGNRGEERASVQPNRHVCKPMPYATWYLLI